MMPVVGYAGMTHLGLVSASAAAAAGFRTIGFDPDPALADRLRRSELPVNEPDLPETIERGAQRLAFSADVAALSDCDLVYIAVDVPTDANGDSDLGPIGAMVQRVGAALKDGAALVILSQVPPGYTRALPVERDRLFYQVETLIFGRAVERATKPERFIVGCADPSLPLPRAIETYLKGFGCPILPMRFESAELCKIAINCCLVSSTSVANTL